MTADNEHLPPLSKEESEQIEKDAAETYPFAKTNMVDDAGWRLNAELQFFRTCWIAGATLERRKAKAEIAELRKEAGYEASERDAKRDL